MAKGFSLMNIAQMNFYGRNGYCGHGVTNGYASVGIGTWINQNALVEIQTALNLVH